MNQRDNFRRQNLFSFFPLAREKPIPSEGDTKQVGFQSYEFGRLLEYRSKKFERRDFPSKMKLGKKLARTFMNGSKFWDSGIVRVQ